MATRYMTDDKTLWILVNRDFSGGAIVGYRLDDGGFPIAEHDLTYQWHIAGETLINGAVLPNPKAHKMLPTGYPADNVSHDVPAHVIGRAVALANQIAARQKIASFAETLTW